MRSRRNTEVNHSWLHQFETEGPFLSLPVVKSIWPTGVDRLGDTDDRAVTFKQAYADWLRAYDARSSDDRHEYAEITRTWIDTVLGRLADWEDLRVAAIDLPPGLEIHSPGEQLRVRADGALEGRDTDYAAMLRIIEPSDDLRGPGLDGWSATEIDRMAALLRKADVEIGIVTDGRWWAIVWANRDKPTGSAITDAATWGEEPLVRDAFLTLINQRRFRAKDADERLTALLQRSELEAEEITAALGTQVRKAVELLVASFSEMRLDAKRAGEPDPLPEKPDDVYQAAVTVMMRVVFLLFAEERGMLPTEQLYTDSYAIRDVLDDLRKRAVHGEELLDETYDTWHRLLAVSEALHGGVNYDEMRMPAYGGSLLDPDRFEWLVATDERGLRVKVSDRVMLHVLRSVQYAHVGKEPRRISFRDIDVEQIGYIYEGLLGYTCTRVEDEVVIGLHGKEGEEPEIGAAELQQIYDGTSDGRSFATALREWLKDDQPSATPATVAKIAKAYDGELTPDERAEVVRQLNPIAGDDKELLDFLVDWSPLIRADLTGIPHVVPRGGLVVTETPSRKHAGAHYTPRSLAEEVVQHALEPLVYEPGPLQENDRHKWQLKGSTAILDLKVADIAAGSGAFLVAAARFLAERVVEAWTAEDAITPEEIVQPGRAYERAVREVVARCLYGADINPMAVEMCKLSLWLVSLDPTKPFSFIDDKIFLGNSLLGITNVDQLRHLHIHPERAGPDLITELVDIDAKFADATRLRRELATPVVEHDPMRSRAGKARLLRQSREATAELREIADGIIAAGLPHGGKPNTRLDDAYKALAWALSEAYPRDGSQATRTNLDAVLDQGLTPTVETDYERWRPLHWAIEAPDVMLKHNGFDAIVGNPPFLAGKKIAIANGSNMESWSKLDLRGLRGSADLCAHFIRRAWNLVRPSNGVVGLIANDRVGQGHTSDMSTRILAKEGAIYRAISQFRWPGKASTSASILWAVRQRNPRPRTILDGRPAESISPSLEDRSEADLSTARRLKPKFLAGMGVGLYGEGFVLRTDDPILTRLGPAEIPHLRKFVNGDSLLSGRDSGRIAIDVNCFQTESDLLEAAPVLGEHLRRTVKPVRDKVTSQVHDSRYWGHWDKRESLFAGTSDLPWFIATAETTRLPIFLRRSDSSTLFTNKVIVFATASYAHFGILSSVIHFAWFEATRTPRGATSSYTVTRVLRPFPFPENSDELARAAKHFDDARIRALKEYVSVTKLYNAFDTRIEDDPLVVSLRAAQARLDEAACLAYGWGDLVLDHGFFTFSAGEHYTVSPAVRAEIRHRLLRLNHEQARAEGQDVPEQDRIP